MRIHESSVRRKTTQYRGNAENVHMNSREKEAHDASVQEMGSYRQYDDNDDGRPEVKGRKENDNFAVIEVGLKHLRKVSNVR